jgi:hypothetical protein
VTSEKFEQDIKKIREDVASKRKQAKQFEFANLEDNLLYRYNNIYLKKLIKLAQEKSVKVTFMYLPYLGSDNTPDSKAWVAQFGTWIVPESLIAEASFWQNADHLNFFGAVELSKLIAERL